MLSRHAVDRRTPIRASDALLDEAWASPKARVVSVTRKGLVLLRSGALVADVPDSSQRPEDAFYLGVDADAHWFARVAEIEPTGELSGIRDVAAALNGRDAALLVHALALVNWHATHTHCPRCGSPTRVAHGGHVRICPRDDSLHFPRTDPAVIMLVSDGSNEHLLLGRQPGWPAGRWSCLAGFVEPGESAEQAVIRETREESSVRVRDVTYLASQPWPFPGSLMLGYRATADPKEPVDVSDDELEDARWFTRAEIIRGIESELLLPPPLSIARYMIDGWLGGV